MSLHTLAQHLQSAGRGDDKVLVHMTPGEVSGLQSLAMAHGGSLTTNPETGLPEAGFLSAILPAVAGAALAATGVGAPMAALMVGGAGTLATGSLSKGLMMGLGAFGGAGLGSGLMGAAEAGTAGALGSAQTIAAQNAAAQAATSASQIGNTMGAASNLGAGTVLPTAAPATTMPGVIAGGTGTMAGAPAAAVTQPAVVATGQVSPTTGLPAGAPSVETATSAFDKFKSIPGKAFDLLSGQGEEADKAREEFYKKYKMPLFATGISALALSREEPKMPSQQNVTNYQTFNPTYNRIAQSGGNYQAGPYTGTSERRYFAEGGLADLPVEQMSQQASVGANTNYPMANIRPYGYAVPRNVPISENVFKPTDYQRVDPYTGEQKFAGGGLASLVSMATGGFVSKLKPVAKPKLTDLKPLDTKIQSLEKYSDLGALQNRYSDLKSKVADLNNEKAAKAKELAERTKASQAQIAAINKEKAARLAEMNKEYSQKIAEFDKESKVNVANRTKELNTEYTNRINDFNKETSNEIKNRQADISREKDANARRQMQQDLANFQKDRSTQLAGIRKDLQSSIADVNRERTEGLAGRKRDYENDVRNTNNDYASKIKDMTNDLNTFKSEVTKFNTDAAKQLTDYSKELATERNASSLNKQYQQAVQAKEKAQAANDAATEKYNKYQEDLTAEKQAWQEETGRKATGLQAIRPQTTTTALDNSAKIAELQKQLASMTSGGGGLGSVYGQNQQAAEIQKQIDALKSGASGYTPAYIKDPKTGKLIPASEAEPITEFKPFSKVPGYDTTKRLMEEKDITAVFEDVAGRRPTADEMNRFLGTMTTDAAIAQYAMNAPDVKAAMNYTDDDFKENFQYYMGRQPTTGELAAMKKANITNFNQMRTFLQSQPAYLQNLNKVAQSAFTAQQKSAEEALAEQARLAASLTPEQVSTAYKDVLGRAPSMAELNQYMGAQQTQEGLAGILKGSQEYLGKLTQPFVPTPTPKYAPGTVLEYTPQQQAATGLGAITGGLTPTPSGLQTPLTRGAVTLEGAMPLNPTFTEQMGLQTLATQAAEKAPQLQTGLQFAAAQPQNTFGFQPYAAGAQSPQSIEAILAALRAQQQQGVTQMADGGYAGGGYHLGDYSDGGRLLKGPGNGTSDSIPASIGGSQPARLADGEFVIPARIVSELGNGSTDAGARELYAMMERIQRARGKTVGKNKVAVDAKARNMLPV